ncbi:MerR family transcriptional regulator [Streptomyces rimosus]|uniref:MerR family transcriptional regulator n=1 Tax=Streptomyces rimosus TaxID=1927 RepID=UPI0031D1D433
MTDQPPPAEYRIEDLAHISGTSVRTIRAYQDRGLLPKPERRGRANVYGDEHLERLRRTSDLLDRGYTLASIKELLEAWDTGRGLGGVLGLVAEIDGPWSDEEAARITRAELDAAFGGTPDEAALADAVELGVLERLPGSDDAFRVPSPQELAVAAELHSAGVPLTAISGHLRELRGQVEHIAARFLDFTTEYVFHPYLDHQPTEAEATEAADLVRRLRPLAQQTVDAELARAMRTLATRYIHHHLGGLSGRGAGGDEAEVGSALGAGFGSGLGSRSGSVPGHGEGARADASPGTGTGATGSRTTDPGGDAALGADVGVITDVDAGTRTDSEPIMIALPADTVRAVRELVGHENAATFITAAAQREVHARTMDELAARRTPPG